MTIFISQVKKTQSVPTLYHIAENNLRNYTIFSLIPASAHVAERANIVEIPGTVEVFITNYTECVVHDIKFSNKILQNLLFKFLI